MISILEFLFTAVSGIAAGILLLALAYGALFGFEIGAHFFDYHLAHHIPKKRRLLARRIISVTVLVLFWVALSAVWPWLRSCCFTCDKYSCEFS